MGYYNLDTWPQAKIVNLWSPLPRPPLNNDIDGEDREGRLVVNKILVTDKRQFNFLIVLCGPMINESMTNVLLEIGMKILL